MISRKCPKEKSYFWPLYLGQRSNRGQSHMTSLGYLSGHLVQVWSKSAQPWSSNIKFNVISPEQFLQIISIEEELYYNFFSNLLFCSPIALEWMIDRRASRSISTRHDVWCRVVQDCAWSVQLNIKANGPLLCG